jgi:hypothetical protein
MIQKLLSKLQTYLMALCNWVHQKYFCFFEVRMDEVIGQLFQRASQQPIVSIFVD